jgi:TetR/AcrR family transcriptional regulator, transcriptional repressor for nem operon
MARTKSFDPQAALGKAMRVFWRKGYEAASMQELVDAMGINRQSLYDTFGDKHALYLAALKCYSQSAALSAVQPLIEIGSWPGTVASALRATLQNIAQEELSDREHKGCMIANAALECAGRDDVVGAVVSAAAAATESLFYDALALGKQRGEFPSDFDARAYARFFANAVNGLRVMGKTSRNSQAMRDVIDITMRTLGEPGETQG